MRKIRYVLLAIAVLAIFSGLFWIARRHAVSHAEQEAASLSDALEADLSGFGEHARYLAAMPAGQAMLHLAYFHALAGVEIHDAKGKEILHAERYGDLVAKRPSGQLDSPAPDVSKLRVGEVEVSGFLKDENRRDVAPALRNVLRYTAKRPGGGSVVLTVYAEPFLRPLRSAGAGLSSGDRGFLLPRPDPPYVRLAARRWTIYVPVGLGDVSGDFLWTLGGVGVAVLALAGVAVVLSERQIRLAERAAIQESLARNDRLSSLGLLVAGIAHEINNPLEGIANWIRLGRTEKAQEGFERIRKIVRELLAFAAPGKQAGRADLAECLDHALELARYSKAFAEVEVDAGVRPGLLVASAPQPLEQVFLNLLLNAGKAMEGVGTRRLEISARRKDGTIAIAFRDFGPGVPAGDLDRVFDPFFSGSGGTGLGLSVSYGIVRAVGGDLRVENVGPGARLTVELPAG